MTTSTGSNPADLRVLKAHTEAARDVIENFGKPYREDPDGFHHSLASAVLSAADSKTRFVIIQRALGGLVVHGPFATWSQALAVGSLGLLGLRGDWSVEPLHPAPKKPRKVPAKP